MSIKQSTSRSEQGFTLVELAIVLIIVGLLIGGILKGQELIMNARLSTTAAQIKAVEAAVNTFQDTYQSLPGDMLTATTRIPGCAGACVNGSGNGVLSNAANVAQGPSFVMGGNENGQFFYHLSLADMIDAGAPAANTAAGFSAGQGLIASNVNSGSTFRVGSAIAAADLAGANPAAFRAGTYIAIAGDEDTAIATPPAAAALTLRPSQAQRIDDKYDDGRPNTGSSFAGGTAGAAGCTSAALATGNYNTQLDGSLCLLYARIL